MGIIDFYLSAIANTENVDLRYKQTNNALLERSFCDRLPGPVGSREEIPLARLYLILANIRKRNDQQCRKPVRME